MTNHSSMIFLVYPPGDIFQRGEDRCQSNLEDATTQAIRPCNDLGYASSTLKQKGFQTYLKDYQTERLTMKDLMKDLAEKKPRGLFLSTTNSTIHIDTELARVIKKEIPDVCVIFKGAIFFDAEDEMLAQIDLSPVDYLIGGESDFVVADLFDAHFNDKEKIKEIRGILFRENGAWQRTDFTTWEEDLDQYPFPDRAAMNNDLYLRPDTGERMATIATSRGCSASCIYCMTPVISGKKIRVRSPQNIYEELLECYRKYGIRNFFFKSDTFTLNRKWVVELCNLICNSELNGKIEWVANSRVNPIEFETLVAMKKAGCWLVAFGFESGNDEMLKKIRKGATVNDNLRAAELAKKAGLNVLGFFMAGLPWEDMKALKDTENMIFKMKPDFIEVHMAVPFYGTKMHEEFEKENLINETVLGKDYFNSPTKGTKYLTMAEVEEFRRKLLLKFYTRPSYIYTRLKTAITKPKVLANYYRYGTRMLKTNLKMGKEVNVQPAA